MLLVVLLLVTFWTSFFPVSSILGIAHKLCQQPKEEGERGMENPTKADMKIRGEWG